MNSLQAFGLSVALVTQWLASATAQVAYVNFEGKQTNPVRLSPDGTRLFAVNTPDARLSVFDVSNPSNPILIAEIPVGLEPVSVNPRSNDEAWVVNEVSDSVSVVSVSRGIVTDTLHVKDEPADIVFAQGRAFVTAARRNEIHVFDLNTHTNVAVIPVLGHNPRALAVSPDGSKVYAAFALSGNRTTIIRPKDAPPPPMPTSITNPPPQVGLIVDARDTNWSHVIKYTMPDNDIVEIDSTSLTVNRYFRRVGTVNLGLAVHPASGDLFVANTDARNLVRFEPNVRGHIVENRVSRVAITDGSVEVFDLNLGIDYNTLPNLSALASSLAQPTAIAFDATGNSKYVAAFGTDRIARLDASGKVLSRIEAGPSLGTNVNPRTKRGPRGLALNAGAQRLYVLNRIANTLSVIDTASDTVIREIPIGSFDPTPAAIRDGRGFLYDAKLSGNGTAACASCHVDAEMDFLAWNLGNPNGSMGTTRVNLADRSVSTRPLHPMKGPMTTQTLRGLSGQDPLHWRGDRTNFLHFNGAFSSLLGGNVLTTADMSAFRSFINTIVFQPNPNQKPDRTFAAQVGGGNPAAGRSSFVSTRIMSPGANTTCAECHELPAGVGPIIIPAEDLLQSQAMKVPHLRSVYQKLDFSAAPGATNVSGFGLAHDGIDGGLMAHFSIDRFLPVLRNDPAKQRDLAAYIMSFDTGTAPAVGHSLTLNASNMNDSVVTNDWNILENQPATDIGLIVKGTIQGVQRGLLYNRSTRMYETDRSGLGPFSRADLVASALAGDTLTIMGVPPTSRRRMAIDRNANGVLDGDEVRPTLTAARSNASISISWPTNTVGVVLEFSESLLPQSWKAETSVRNLNADQITVTVPAADRNRFYRLRGL